MSPANDMNKAQTAKKYLTAAVLEQFGEQGIDVTIRGMVQESMRNPETQQVEQKWCLAFEGKTMMAILGSPEKPSPRWFDMKDIFGVGQERNVDCDALPGKVVNIYRGRTTQGGPRVAIRASKGQTQAPPAPEVTYGSAEAASQQDMDNADFAAGQEDDNPTNLPF